MTLLDDPVAEAAPPVAEAAPPVTLAPERRGWERHALLALLAATAVLYLWGLSSSGWANNFYAAAVQAGTQDLKAFLFGSLDPGNAITVDKPPASLWVMALSARLFGFSALSMLLPEALMGVGAVALLFATVRRCSGPAAGLTAAAVLALTPVAALMFRYNQPDALLTLLLTAAAYFMVRAVESGSTRWIALAGTVIGFTFLTKMLEAALVVPGFALVFLLAAPGRLPKRLWQLLVGVAAIVVSAGWFIALVSLWPAGSRPYIGGSTDNSLLQLALGYNGIERVAGGNGIPGGDNPMFGGPSGIGRLFALSMGTEISWLLPAALIGLIAGVWCTAGTAHNGAVRTQLLLWGGWLLLSGAVFSFMHGVIHPYYTVELAPAIAALIGISVRELWRGREFTGSRMVLAAMSATTGVWAFILLDRTPTWLPALRWTVLIGSIAVAFRDRRGCPPAGPDHRRRRGRRTAVRCGVPRRVHDRHGCRCPCGADTHLRTRPRHVRSRTHRCSPWPPGRQQRTAGIAQGRPNPLGRGIGRINGREQPGASDRRVGDGDRRIQGIRQFTDAASVPARRHRSADPLLHRRPDGGHAGRPVAHRSRHHRVGPAPLHADRRRRHDGVRPVVTCKLRLRSGRQSALDRRILLASDVERAVRRHRIVCRTIELKRYDRFALGEQHHGDRLRAIR